MRVRCYRDRATPVLVECADLQHKIKGDVVFVRLRRLMCLAPPDWCLPDKRNRA
jgi:hypothetical protein